MFFKYKQVLLPSSLAAIILLVSGMVQAADPVVQFRSVLTGKCLQSTNNFDVETAVCNANEPRQFFTNPADITNAFGQCMGVKGRNRASPEIMFGSCPTGNPFQYNLTTKLIAAGTTACVGAVAFSDARLPTLVSVPVCDAQQAGQQWDAIVQTTPISGLTPASVSQHIGRCMQLNQDPALPQIGLADCVIGAPSQNWALNQNNQIVNSNGQCLAASQSVNIPDFQLVADTCQIDTNHVWEFINGKTLRLAASNQCLYPKSAIEFALIACDLVGTTSIPIFPNVYFIGSTTPPQNNLIAKNDSYGTVANIFHGQLIFDIPAAKGVRINDTPSSWPTGLSFEIVSPVTRTAGTGKAVMSVFFRDTGGFYATIRTEATTMAARQADKRGAYQFTYKMVMNGQSSAPATVTLSIF